MIGVIRWFGTGCALAGAIMIAANVPWSGWGFVPFLASSLAWSAAAVLTGDRAQLAMQLGFVAVNVLGIVRWLT